MTWHMAACNDTASAAALVAAFDALSWDISSLNRGDRLLYTLDGTREDIPDGIIAAMEQHATVFETLDEAGDVAAWIESNYVGDELPA